MFTTWSCGSVQYNYITWMEKISIPLRYIPAAVIDLPPFSPLVLS